ncbi:hypothetical protein K9M16_02035 [Candidatus Babeliales bacterium]|nr:hypothetical protein [Candidatus Babeliales bacterium]
MKKFVFIFLSCLLGAQTLTAGLSHSKPKETIFCNNTNQQLQICLTEGFRKIQHNLDPKSNKIFFTGSLKKCSHINIKSPTGLIGGITFACDGIKSGEITFTENNEQNNNSTICINGNK